MKIAIKADKLTKVFNGKIAVDGVSFSIEKGSIYGFLGPNGAGKSTMVKMLVTILSPTTGDATVQGYSISREADAVRLRIGVALQDAALDGQQTGYELLEIQGRLYGLSKAQVTKRIEELAPLIDIGDALKQRIKTYSGGMKRRVDLAAALIHNPDVLFLDEPTTGLDPISRNKVWEEVRKLNRELGMTIFLTTQYLEEADQLADHIGIINNGVLVAEDTPKALKARIGNDVIHITAKQDFNSPLAGIKKIKEVSAVNINRKNIYINTKNSGHVIAEVIEECRKAKIEVANLEIRGATLDDVFLEVTGNLKKEEVK